MTDEQMAQVKDPMQLLKSWLDEAQKLDLPHPEAMCLATTNSMGEASTRIVLAKDVRPEGLVFYTNYHSQKGLDIEVQPTVSANFFWDAISKQIKVFGSAEKTSREDSEKYWNSRPRESQIAQYTSKQSRPAASRQQMEGEYTTMQKEFAQGPVPCPKHWGGYLIKPKRIEFWTAKANRFHDRCQFTRQNGQWLGQRLYP